eukprot:jgi/Chrzof1/12473/Cz06g35180.t1
MLLPDDLLPKLDKGRFLGRVWRLEKQEQRKLSQMIDQTDNDAACLAALTLMLEKGPVKQPSKDSETSKIVQVR